jgi:hypothetical protein
MRSKHRIRIVVQRGVVASVAASLTACSIPSPHDAEIGCLVDAQALDACVGYVAPIVSADVTVTPDDSTFATNGYGKSGTWKGSCSTGMFPPAVTTVQISPACALLTDPCFSSAGKQLCTTGNVGGDSTYTSGAFLGCNIAEDQATGGASPPVGTVATSGTGLQIKVSGNTDGLRVNLSSDAAGTKQWCADLPAGGSGQIKWTDFFTECWYPGTGTAYTVGTPIASVAVNVPSSPFETPFGFCLVSIAQY